METDLAKQIREEVGTIIIPTGMEALWVQGPCLSYSPIHLLPRTMPDTKYL